MADERDSGESKMQANHRKRIEQIRDDMISLAGTAAKVADVTRQVLEKGGTVNIQPQMSFITSAYARMMKDVGVIEFLQAQGMVVKRPTPTK